MAPPSASTGGAVSAGRPSTWDELVAVRRARIEAELVAAVDDGAARLAAIDADLVTIGAEVAAFVGHGGKRLRPLLVLLGNELAGGTGDVLPAAVAVELLHTWALMHDDVIDADETRRGRPTTHRQFARRHREGGWAGDPDRYGDAMALLVGDVVSVLSDESFEQAPVDRATLAAARADFAAMRLEVMAGQVLDVQVAAERTTDRRRALRVATLKSGRYSVTRPLQLGARLADADPDLLARLEEFGDPLGVAFQLRDDLLGVLGDPGRTGKPVGGDLREGKRTLLVAEAMARLGPDDAALLEGALGDPDLPDDLVDARVDDLVACGAVAAVQDRVDDLLAAADSVIAGLGPSPATTALQALAAALGDRTH